EKLDQGFDVVGTSYWMPGGQLLGVPARRRMMSLGVNLMFRLLFPVQGMRCYTNGFRGYRAASLQRAHAHYKTRIIEHAGVPAGHCPHSSSCLYWHCYRSSIVHSSSMIMLYLPKLGIWDNTSVFPIPLEARYRAGGSTRQWVKTIPPFISIFWPRL